MTLPSRTLLLVDDDEDILQALEEVLDAHGYSTRRAANGLEALAQLEREPTPVLVILDLMMPVMSGWQLLEELCQRPALAHVPVIVVSASRERVAAPSLKGQLSKPFSIPDLLAQVRSAVEP